MVTEGKESIVDYRHKRNEDSDLISEQMTSERSSARCVHLQYIVRISTMYEALVFEEREIIMFTEIIVIQTSG